MDHELLVHRQVERDVEGADKSVSAVGIATKISLRYTRHQMENPFRASEDRGKGQEDHIVTRHKGVRITVGGFLLIHLDGVVGQRAMGIKLTQQRDIEQLEGNVRPLGDLPGDLCL